MTADLAVNNFMLNSISAKPYYEITLQMNSVSLDYVILF